MTIDRTVGNMEKTDYMSKMKVNKRGGFSDRHGIKPLNQEIQIYSLDDHTRTAIANTIHNFYEEVYDNSDYRDSNVQAFFKFVYSEIYSTVVSLQDYIYTKDFWQTVDSTVLHDDYDDVLTLVEGVAQYWDKTEDVHKYDEWSREYKLNVFWYFNDLFEKEYVGYRFVGNSLSYISNENELQEISSALNTPFASVNEHMEKANLLLSNRQNPDYENSIKESISSVEALCKIITKEHGNGATLGKMIKKLTSCGVYIQPALLLAFDKLYGFTCDAKGIRHAGDIGGADATFEEAKFMLVACSAFINYVKGNIAKIDPAIWRS